MRIASLLVTDHAARRSAQRNLKKSDLDYVCTHGAQSIQAGVIRVFLGRKHIAEEDRRNDSITRLEGTTVLLDSHDGETVITAYRNRESTKKDRRKAKYNRKSS